MTKAAANGEDRSYNFYCSAFFLGSLYLCSKWCDPKGHHGIASIDGGWARIGGFAPFPSPSPEASADEDDDADDDEDGASFSGDDKMMTS